MRDNIHQFSCNNLYIVWQNFKKLIKTYFVTNDLTDLRLYLHWCKMINYCKLNSVLNTSMLLFDKFFSRSISSFNPTFNNENFE